MAFIQLVVWFILTLAYIANGQGRGALRLVRNNRYSTVQAYTSGIVEIYSAGSSSTWGNICFDGFAYTEANVICHQLGFNGVSTHGSAGSITTYGTDTNSMAIEDVSCSSSSYLSLLSQCTFSSAHSSTCTNSDYYDLYVICYTTKIWNNPYNGQIRLIGGTYSNQGRLEVYCNGQWGTVCDDTFGSTDAYIACRQLGYNDYSRYDYTTSLAGSSSQPIWLDRLTSCSSSLSCLGYCERCPSSQYHDCRHSEDVALECEYLSTRSRVFTTLSTCRYASPTSSSPTSSTSAGAVIGGVVGGSILLCFIVLCVVGICICCCVGMSSSSSNRRRRPVAVTTATPGVGVAKTTPIGLSYAQQPPPPPSYDQATNPKVQQMYPAQPAAQPYSNQPYPDQPYPNQPYPYPNQPYPDQGYPNQQYPSYPNQAYPNQQPHGYTPQYPPPY